VIDIDTEVDALFGLLNIINYRYALMSDPTEHWTALSHLWTLSVEGQYYVIWPALLTILLRRGRKVALHVTVAAILAIAAWRGIVFVSSASPYYKIYFSSDTRADELMFGCALALWRTGGLRGIRVGVRAEGIWSYDSPFGGTMPCGVSGSLRNSLAFRSNFDRSRRFALV